MPALALVAHTRAQRQDLNHDVNLCIHLLLLGLELYYIASKAWWLMESGLMLSE